MNTELGKLDSAVAKYQKDVLKKAYDAAVKAAKADTKVAKDAYDKSLAAAKKAQKDANTAYGKAISGYKTASYEKSYNDAFKKATSSA